MYTYKKKMYTYKKKNVYVQKLRRHSQEDIPAKFPNISEKRKVRECCAQRPL